MPDRRVWERAGQHSIEAIMRDGTHHQFSAQVLDVLLESNRVMKFRRKSGWVTVGVDPVRVRNRREASHSFHGNERRATN